jgi:hypothetical protein
MAVRTSTPTPSLSPGIACVARAGEEESRTRTQLRAEVMANTLQNPNFPKTLNPCKPKPQSENNRKRNIRT